MATSTSVLDRLVAKVPDLVLLAHTLLESFSLLSVLSLLVMWLHHTYVSPHIRTPGIKDLSWACFAPMISRSVLRRSRSTSADELYPWSIRNQTVLYLSFILIAVADALRLPRANFFCHVYKFDNACLMAESRYYLMAAQACVAGLAALLLVAGGAIVHGKTRDGSIWSKVPDALAARTGARSEVDKRE
ncbi:hypothetical protein JCM10212_006534 [Sporobolomyces blumeae]